MFMCNKGLMLNVSLSELKQMTPEEMYLFLEQMNNISQEMEKAKNGI